MKRYLVLSLTAFILLFANCSSETPQGNSKTCTQEGKSCTSYIGSAYTADALKAACSTDFSYSTSQCSKDNCLGKCFIAVGTDKELELFYYQGSGLSTADAKSACQVGIIINGVNKYGTWSESCSAVSLIPKINL